MAEQCDENIQTAQEDDDQTERVNITVNIAITGETGSGKSTLVNALRGIKNRTEGAAPTGVTEETTMEPTEYIHPQNKNIRIWDLPGVGTVNFTADKYLEYVGFEKYDIFIIVSSERFRENDAKLAKEIQKMKKKFYFVRSKIDNNIRDEKEDNPNFNEEDFLKMTRDNCTKELQKLGFESPKVFLVSGLRLDLYEFKDLWKTLEEELGIIMAEQCDENIQTAQEDDDQTERVNITVNIAITGESGSGKSTLVNALRGIKNRTEGAAKTGVTEETTMEPTEYIHPQNKNIRIWDLPGVGTVNFTADKYLEYVEFEKYDIFIIVSSDRFRENYAKLAKEIQKMNKKFYFVRSKIDHNVRDEKEDNPNLNEEDFLKMTRDNCTKELQKLGFESPKVFLVSGLRLDLYEFKDLWKTLEEELGTIMADHYEEEIKTALQNNNLALAAVKAKKYLDRLKNVCLNIAITGESGSGKSTLVNALRGIKNRTEGAAETGATETTMKPTEYIHPQNNNIRIWDLPGVGTVNFTADKYLEHVGFEKYDFFIIVSSDRFRENDAKLAKEIQKMKKKFYFVRSKIDHNIRDEKEEDPDFNEEDFLHQIRDNCIKELKKLDIESPKVFLLCSHDLYLYEFVFFCKTLNEELSELQRDALFLALPNISLDVIEQKKKALESRIKWYALASAVGAAVPVPSLSVKVDMKIMSTFAEQCQNSLCLSHESLQKLSDVSGVPLEDLKMEIKSSLSVCQITRDRLLKELTAGATYIREKILKEGDRFVKFFEISVAMTLSGVTIYFALQYILKTQAEDAQRVFNKALRRSTSSE